MELARVLAYLRQEFTYPVTKGDVIAEIGDREIDAPDHSDSETIETILGGLGDETYESPDAVFDAIIGNLPDEYIGRKYYDDRGGDPTPSAPGPRDDRDTSF